MYHVERKKRGIINQLIDWGVYKDGRRQLYELELSELRNYLKDIKREQVILHS
ncbi:Fur-regulated basic protein FbpA [Bacillus cereus]